MTLKKRFAWFGGGIAIACTAVLVGQSLFAVDGFAREAERASDRLKDESLHSSLHAASELVASQDAVLQRMVQANVRMVERLARDAGGIRFGPETQAWTAVNQFTKVATDVQLPTFKVGQTAVAKQSDPNAKVPLVDDAAQIAGATFTIFQRLNPQGDMIRVATNVINDKGKRAISTYIPATNPDGKPNPVLAAVLAGKQYTGVAFVVDQWYVTSYMPFRGADGQIAGMVYSGLKQHEVSSLRDAVRSGEAGEHGAFYVVGAKDPSLGKLLVEPSNADVAPPEKVLMQLVEKTADLQHEQVAQVPYRAANGVERVALATRYAPWSWVVVADIDPRDFNQAANAIRASRGRFAGSQLALAGLVVGLALVLAALMSNRAVKPILALGRRLEEFSQGQSDLTVRLDESGRDEMAGVARAFNAYLERLQDTVRSILSEAGKVSTRSQDILGLAPARSDAATSIGSAAEDTRRTSVEAAESARAAQGHMAELMAAVEAVAQGAQEQARRLESGAQRVSVVAKSMSDATDVAGESAAAASQLLASAKGGASDVEASREGLGRIRSTTHAATDAIRDLGAASERIGAIVQAIEEIAEQTNLLALNAAIEAARAGEQGRGFAVVADEVRKLAESSGVQAKGIASLIREVQVMTQRAVSAMDAGVVDVEAGVELADRAATALQQIQQAAATMSHDVQTMAGGIASIRGETDSLMEEITALAAITEETSASAQEMAAACMEVSRSLDETARTGQAQAERTVVVAQEAGRTRASAESTRENSEELAASARSLALLMDEFRVDRAA